MSSSAARGIWIVSVIVILGSISNCRGWGSEEEIAVQANVSFCDLHVPPELMHGNYSNSIIYRFIVGRDGEPADLSKVQDVFIGVDQVERCVEGWSFRSLEPGTEIRFLFYWKHGVGWTKLIVVGPEFSFIVTQPPSYTAYSGPSG